MLAWNTFYIQSRIFRFEIRVHSSFHGWSTASRWWGRARARARNQRNSSSQPGSFHRRCGTASLLSVSLLYTALSFGVLVRSACLASWYYCTLGLRCAVPFVFVIEKVGQIHPGQLLSWRHVNGLICCKCLEYFWEKNLNKIQPHFESTNKRKAKSKFWRLYVAPW